MLEVNGLRKRWGPVQALDGFDLTIAAGEICGLMGHNGAGKTTFARMCSGLERPDAGSVRIDGLDIGTAGRASRHLVGLAPQELALYPTATLRQNLRFFGGLAGLRRRALNRETEEIAEAMRLTDVLDRPVGRLSGGQQRRGQAATALLHRPVVLLLDEPTVGADPATREVLLHLVKDRAGQGAAVCYTTHYLPELEVLDATLAVAAAGKVVARGSREELTAGLPGEVVIAFKGPVPGRVAHRGTVSAEPGELHISAVRPAEALAAVLSELGPDTEAVRAVEVREPSLDDLYRRLEAGARSVREAGAPHAA